MSVKKVRLILKACAEDTRLRILNLLNGKELTVKEICQALKVTQPVISKHLSRLRLLKIVVDKRQGNLVFYRITNKKDSFQYKIINFLFPLILKEFREFDDEGKGMDHAEDVEDDIYS